MLLIKNPSHLAGITLALLLASCDKHQPPAPSAQQPTAHLAPVNALDSDSEWARNREQVPFCLPIPKGDYVRDNTAELPRGSLAYVHKTREADTIEIQGLIRADTSVSIADYFRATYADAEASGKIIEEKKLFEAQGLFYARGYWSNKINEQRFIEITWLRKDEAVRYTTLFALDSSEAWQRRLESLLKHSSRCE